MGSQVPYNFDWRPGIGDPTIGGWITVALYFIACVSCRRTMVTVLSPRSSEQFDGFIWRGIAIMFFLLGINKQLDLQSAFTEIGRMIAASEGGMTSVERYSSTSSLALSPFARLRCQ